MSEISQRKVPPHSAEAERAVLGSMMKQQSAFAAVAERLNEEDFYLPSHRQIFEAMMELQRMSKPVDEVTVVEYLDKRGILKDAGGIGYVIGMQREVPVVTNLPYYVNIVEEKATLRNLISACEEIVSDAYSGANELSEVLSAAEKRIFDISLKNTTGGLIQIEGAVTASYLKISERVGMGDVSGLPTGFIDLDKKLSGLQKSDLIVVAGRPAMGKTSFAINIAQHAGMKEDAVVAIFSLEMAREQLASRMLCSEAKVDMQKARTGQMEPEDWQSLAAVLIPLAKSKIYIDDTAGISIAQMSSKLRRLKMQLKHLDLVVIDYLQLMTYKGRADNRQQEVSEITRALKILARELNVPVILLSQLSREPEKRADKRPMISDLRESGSIEQDADIVILLFRESAYDPQADNTALAIVAKHRNGPTGDIELLWRGEYTKFENLAHEGY